MQKVKMFQDFRLNEETPNLEVKAKGVDGKVLTVVINGNEYGYEAKDDGIDVAELASKFKKMLVYSSGKALTWLKKNSALVKGSKKNESEDLSFFGIVLNEDNEYVVNHVKMFEDFAETIRDRRSFDDDFDDTDDDVDSEFEDVPETPEEGSEEGSEDDIVDVPETPEDDIPEVPEIDDEETVDVPEEGSEDDIVDVPETPEEDDIPEVPEIDDEEIGEPAEEPEESYFKESLKEGLSAKQKKLPLGLQKAILKKQGEKMPEEKKKDVSEKKDPKKEETSFLTAKDVEKTSAKIATMASKLEKAEAVSQINTYLKKHAGELAPSHKANLKGAIDILNGKEEEKKK